MKDTVNLSTVNLTSGSDIAFAMPWGGGQGLIVVVGTFVGAAQINTQSTSNVDAGPGNYVNLNPLLPTITAPGTYSFTAPFGSLNINAQATGVGDSMSLTQLAIVNVNPLD